MCVEEQRRACEMVGVQDLTILNLPDRLLEATPARVPNIAREIRRFQPQAVMCTSWELEEDVVYLLDASVSYGENEVLHDVTWRLAPGERTGIPGVNGGSVGARKTSKSCTKNSRHMTNAFMRG